MPDPSEHVDGQERRSPQVKVIVLDSYGLELEQFRPDRGQVCLKLGARGDGGSAQLRASSPPAGAAADGLEYLLGPV